MTYSAPTGYPHCERRDQCCRDRREALELERRKVARSDTPEFSFEPCRDDGGRLMPWTVEVRLVKDRVWRQ